MLLIVFAGGSYFDLFRCAGWSPPSFSALPWYQKNHRLLLAHHAAGAGDGHRRFAALTMLTKNAAFLDGIRKQYVVTARAKGVGEKQIVMGFYVFVTPCCFGDCRFPATFIGMFLPARC